MSKSLDIDADLEISRLESLHSKDKTNIDTLVKLSTIYIQVDKPVKSRAYLHLALKSFKQDINTVEDGMRIVDATLECWRCEKYLQKNSIFINNSDERKSVLSELSKLLTLLKSMRDPNLGEIVRAKLAFVKECLGQYQDSLALLSDLITDQAVEVDLNFIIFKAAIILKHIGTNVDQAIEYLEFVMDDPPVSEGYTKTHVLAMLAAVYEQSGDHYSVLLEKTYQELLENYSKDLATGKRPVTNQKKLETMMKKKPIHQSSEIFELLGLQALDKCEYVLAAQMVLQAILKAPNKGKLQHVLAEIYFQLGEKEKCKRVAEKAFLLLPQSAELRNLLLIVNPEKWTEKIRTVAPVQVESMDVLKETLKKVDAVKKPDPDTPAKEHWLAKANTAMIVGTAKLLGVGPKTAEQKAIEAVEKERKRREKRFQKEREAAEKAKQEREAVLQQQTKPKRDPIRDGPARPEKPVIDDESTRLIQLLREGNKNVFLYDANLKQFSAIRDSIDADERAWMERKARIASAQKQQQQKK